LEKVVDFLLVGNYNEVIRYLNVYTFILVSVCYLSTHYITLGIIVNTF